MHDLYHEHSTLQNAPAFEAAMTNFPSATASTCGLAGGLHCAVPLDGSAKSIRLHLRMHGHRHPQRQVVQCPWVGCSATLQWTNIRRHIQSIHQGIRFRCPNCNKAYTRSGALAMHTASLKCHSQCLFGTEKTALTNQTFFRRHRKTPGPNGVDVDQHAT